MTELAGSDGVLGAIITTHIVRPAPCPSFRDGRRSRRLPGGRRRLGVGHPSRVGGDERVDGVVPDRLHQSQAGRAEDFVAATSETKAIASARVAVLRHDGPDSYGRPRVSLPTQFDCQALNGVQWQTADAAQIVHDTSTELLLNPRARTGDLQPLNLATEPALAELLSAVDLAELTGEQ